MLLIGNEIYYKIYKKKEQDISILEDINFSFNVNEINLILGSSGSGKSTFVNLISSFLKLQNDNKIYFLFDKNEYPLVLKKHTSKRELKKIRTRTRIIFQNVNLQIFKQTVEEEIKFSIKNLSSKKLKKSEIEIIFNDFVKENNFSNDFLKKSTVNLSEGEKRMLIILCSLLFSPKLLILDEPTINLDFVNKKKIINLITKIKNENSNIFIIIVTHDLDLLKIADKISIISKGKIVFFNTKEELLLNKHYLYENDLLIKGYNDEYIL